MKSKQAVCQEYYQTTDRRELSRLSGERFVELRRAFKDDDYTFALPCTAPGVSDVPTAREVLDSECLSWRNFKVFDRYRVEVRHDLHLLQEAENLLFLEKNAPKVNAPKVVVVFADTCLSHNGSLRLTDDSEHLAFFLVTEYVTRERRLEQIWDGLDHEGRLLLSSKIGEQLKELRSISQSQIDGKPFYGSVTGKRWLFLHPLFELHPTGSGPFLSYHDLVEVLKERVIMNVAVGCMADEWTPYDVEFFQSLESTLKSCPESDQRPVLSHLQVEASDFTVVRSKGQEGGDFDAGFAGWRFLGWYPAWFECAAMLKGFNRLFRNQDVADILRDRILEFIDPMDMDFARSLTKEHRSELFGSIV